VSCHSRPHIELSAWKETPQGCQIGGRSVPVGSSGFPTPCTSCVCTAEGVSSFDQNHSSLDICVNYIFGVNCVQRDRKQLNMFERKVYGRILGLIHDNEKENWRIID
jgi:hypothetical protein